MFPSVAMQALDPRGAGRLRQQQGCQPVALHRIEQSPFLEQLLDHPLLLHILQRRDGISLRYYAHLCAVAGGVDAFLIGTEMPGLTTIRSGASTYPAVTAYKTLAADVSTMLGAGTKIGNRFLYLIQPFPEQDDTLGQRLGNRLRAFHAVKRLAQGRYRL